MALEKREKKHVYDWYQSCVDQEERDRLGAEPLNTLIPDTMGQVVNFPFAETGDWRLEDVLAGVHGINVFPLLEVFLYSTYVQD